MRMMTITLTVTFPMLKGETKEQAEDRLIERIDPDGDSAISWSEKNVENEVYHPIIAKEAITCRE